MTAAGVPGMPLADLNDWLARREAVFVAQAELERQAHELDTMRTARAAADAALASALRTVARGSESDALAARIVAAESFVQAAEKANAQQGSLADQARQAERGCAGAQAKADLAQAAYDAWQTQWRDALADARLDTTRAP